MTKYPVLEHAIINADKAQLEAICNLLVHDYYLFLDSDLKISNYSKNCKLLADRGINIDNIYGKSLQEFIENTDEDLSVIKLEEFVRNNILHEVIQFQFRIKDEFLVMKLSKICMGTDFGWACLLEMRPTRQYDCDFFDNKHLLANLSWFTSHKLRGPLVAMMTLIEQKALPEFADEDNSNALLAQMRQQAANLDEALRTLNSLLSNKNLVTTFARSPNTDKIKNILMLDDEVITHFVAKRIVTEINPELILCSFTEGKEALEFLETFPVDLILLDLNMPSMNGWEFLQIMEQRRMLIPTIIISSSIDTNDINNSFEYPAVKGFINKPVGKDDLIRILTNPAQYNDL
jgi:CheY-like chemotaxis protein